MKKRKKVPLQKPTQHQNKYLLLKITCIILLASLGGYLCYYWMQQPFPFFLSSIGNTLLALSLIPIFILLFIQLLQLFHQIPSSKSSNKQLKNKTINDLYDFIGTLFIAVAISGVVVLLLYNSMIGFFVIITKTIGVDHQQPFVLETSITSNIGYQKVKKIGSRRNRHTFIDPATYQIDITMYTNGWGQKFPQYCYTGPEPIEPISKANFMQGKKSFLGFACTSNCTIYQYFQTITKGTIAANQLRECTDLYKDQPNIKDN